MPSSKIPPPKDSQWNFVRGEEMLHARQWRFPDLETPEQAPVDEPPRVMEEEVETVLPSAPTLEQIEAIQRQAYDEGYAEGKREGFDFGHREVQEEARKEVAAKLARLDRLMSSLEGPFKELDDQVERELLTLVVTMVRQLVRREVRTDPHQIVGVMREAMAILPVDSRNIRVLLHPDEAELVRELYAMSDAEPGWHIVEDPVIEHGGCRVVADASQVDATLESRLNNLIAPLIGGLRSEDQEAEEG